jgi:F420-non-reducing hydrogenase small subunit
MAKPKVAFYWCASCGGCEEAVVDLNEDILRVVDAVDIVFWPVALDFKYKDVEALEDGEITASFINGSIRNSEQEEIAKLLRRKSKVVVAFGSCSHLGGIPGLANFSEREDIFASSYRTSPSTVNPSGSLPQTSTTVPEGELTLPELHDTVKTLDQVIDVDYYIPGCAPPADIVMNALTALLEGNLPEKGSVLAPDKALCSECPRGESKPDKLVMKDVKRVHEIIPDPEKCFLLEGLICLGPATRSGCGSRCIEANMPCRGCFGPTKEVKDHGGKMASAIASIIGSDRESRLLSEEDAALIDRIADPGGTFYRFSLPSSFLQRKRTQE